MQTLRVSHKFLTKTCTPRQSPVCSPVFSRSQRNTHLTTFQTLRSEIKEELLSGASGSSSRNFINQKSQILLRIDNKLEAQIKRKITLQKLHSKMSILSMQRAKFKVSRNNSSVKLDLTNQLTIPTITQFGNSHSTCSKFQSTEFRREAGRYPLNSQVESFRSYLRIILLNHPKKSKQRKSELLSRLLLEYFIEVNQKQVRKDLQQIKAISPQLVLCLSGNNHVLDLNVLRLVDRDISKLVFNICYEVYRKKQKGVTHKQLIKINKEIEYTARRLKFYELALRTIFDLGKLYCEQMQYEKAFQEYTNAVKLAIFWNNKYYQEIAIDKLGICKYYLGDSVSALYFHNNIHHLSQYDLNRIRTEYSNQNEIKRLIEEKKEFKKISQNLALKNKPRQSRQWRVSRQSKRDFLCDDNKQNQSNEQQIDQRIEIGEFTFQKQNRNEFYPITNNFDLKSNLKRIIKIPTLRDKIHVLKRNIKKNDLIGTKRYCGQKYIVPTASIFCSKKENAVERNEVCLSHRSYNRNDIQGNTAMVDKDCKVLVLVLNYFINESFLDREIVGQQGEEIYQNVEGL